MLLATVAATVIAGPIVLGALHPRVVKADEAQDQKFANLHFDSASLTPTQPSEKRFMTMQNDGEFTQENVTLKDLIAQAYGVKPDRVVGGPDWINTQRFDFEARWTPAPGIASSTPPPPPPPSKETFTITSSSSEAPPPPPVMARVLASPPLQAMLRNFLAERTNLKVRSDSQVLPVYELVVANGGPKLAPSQASGDVIRVRMESRVKADEGSGQHTLEVTNGNTRVLCDDLSERLGHEVLDKTGLTGRYNFAISFPAPADADHLASILRDQYGLDLQSNQESLKVFAIDNIDIPQGK